MQLPQVSPKPHSCADLRLALAVILASAGIASCVGRFTVCGANTCRIEGACYADGLCNAGDPDDDGDGVLDGPDTDPLDRFVCRDADNDTCDDCSSGTEDETNDGTDTDTDGLCDAGDPDDDGDGILDGPDTDPFDRFVCRDTDGDTCDDCTSGTSDPANDGIDTDGDGICDAGNRPPVLDVLTTGTIDSVSIVLEQPVLLEFGHPTPTVEAYLGLNGTISISGNTASNYTEGPIDVFASDHTFQELSAYTEYRIIVVAENAAGYSVEETVSRTAGIAPFLDPISFGAVDSTSVVLNQPSVVTPGLPLATVVAYIGVQGVISSSGAVVSNYVQGPVDVSSSGYTFQSLDPNTAYQILVIAENTEGSHKRQGVRTTDPECAGGVKYSNVCYYVSALFTNCHDTCAAKGRSASNETISVVGSQGSPTHCSNVAGLITNAGLVSSRGLTDTSETSGSGPLGFGCSWYKPTGDLWWHHDPETTLAASGNQYRVCACGSPP